MFNKTIITWWDSNNKSFVSKLLILTWFIIVLFFIYKIFDILVLLFFALFLNVLFSPFLNYLNKYKIRDSLWIVVIFIIILILLFIVLFSIVPIFTKQFLSLVTQIENTLVSMNNIYTSKWMDWFDLPWFLKSILSYIDFWSLIEYIKSNISLIWKFFGSNFKNFLANWIWLFSLITNTLFNFVLVSIFTFFIALERKQIRDFFYRFLPINSSKYLLSKEPEITSTLSNWIKWQILLSISIFFLTLIWLLFLNIFGINIWNYFTLALIAWIMEFIPYVWPILAFLPALAIALGISYKAVIAVIILYIIIQQVESDVFVPYIMWKTLEISPFLVLFAMTVWWSLFGIVWILIAVPLVSVGQIFMKDYLRGRK